MPWIVLVFGLVLTPVLQLAVEPASAEDLTQTDQQGPVAVTVTLATAPTVGNPIEVTVVLNTHSVGLDGLAFEEIVALRGPNGSETPPTAVRTEGAGHHRAARLTFPPVGQPGPVQLLVRHVGGVPERTFTWEVR